MQTQLEQILRCAAVSFSRVDARILRERTVARLKAGQIDIVVATDVAARGIDLPSLSLVIHADLPAPGALKAGTFVEGHIVTGTATALMIPAASLVMRDGYAYVFTVDSRGIVSRVRVRTGVTDGDRIEVTEGLVAGQAVVATGAGFLGDGDKVRVVETVDATTSAGSSSGKAKQQP